MQGAARWLGRQQESDGGFGFGARGGGSDIDDTAAVVQALVQAGVPARPIIARASALPRPRPEPRRRLPAGAGGRLERAVDFVGGSGPGGQRTRSGGDHALGSRSPLGYLESLTAADGSVRYSRTGSQTPVWVTAQALTALAGRPFPISAGARAASRTRAVNASAAAHSAGHTRHASAQRARRALASKLPVRALPSAARVNAAANALGRLLGAVLAPTVG